MKKLLIIFIFLINLTQAGEYFLKDGDTILLSYGFSDQYESIGSNSRYRNNNQEQKINTFLDISSLYALKNTPIYLKLGINLTDKQGKSQKNYFPNYDVQYINFTAGLSFDLWQDSQPFGKNNKQYFFLVGDLVTLSLDYTFLNFIEFEFDKDDSYYSYSDKYELEEKDNFNITLSTSWITKEHIIFGWGITYNKNKVKITPEYEYHYSYKSSADFEKYYLNFHLGYLF